MQEQNRAAHGAECQQHEAKFRGESGQQHNRPYLKRSFFPSDPAQLKAVLIGSQEAAGFPVHAQDGKW